MNQEPILLYNSLTRQLEPLTVPPDQTIRWYSCGPTVYDSAHLGHARTFLTFDIVRRVLEHFGYTVTYTMNITDIDDKIINRVRERYLNPDEDMTMDVYQKFVREQEDSFWSDMDLLNIRRPQIVTRVTQFIEKIIAYVDTICDNGFAYVSNSSVYFDSEAFKSAGYNFSPLIESVSERDDNQFLGEKKNHADFALWKAAKPGEISFDSPWGPGRPGWHIECSVMASHILGDEFHVHSGGIDLIFPHHNNEIIQANAYVNKPDHRWVEMFLHSGHLNIDGCKMAKSLKNFITIRKYIEEVGTPQELRLLFLLHRWHKPLDYSADTIDEAKRIDKRFEEFISHIEFVKRDSKFIKMEMTEHDVVYQDLIKQIKIEVNRALRTNIDTQVALNTLLDGVNKTYSYLESDYSLTLVLEFWDYMTTMLNVFGLNYGSQSNTQTVDPWIDLAVNLREDIRSTVKAHKGDVSKPAMGDIFRILDEFRDVKLKEMGVQLQDRGQNQTTKWVPIKK